MWLTENKKTVSGGWTCVFLLLILFLKVRLQVNLSCEDAVTFTLLPNADRKHKTKRFREYFHYWK